LGESCSSHTQPSLPVRVNTRATYQNQITVTTSHKNQIITKLGDGIILFKDEDTGEPIGMELLSYLPSDNRFNTFSVEVGKLAAV